MVGIAWVVAAQKGRLMDALNLLPRAHWTERNSSGVTLLHYACYGDNVAAFLALLAHGLDLGARSSLGWSVAFIAASQSQHRMLALLCAAGADLRATTRTSCKSPLDAALRGRTLKCARVLVANGVRLSTVGESSRCHITPELHAFERGVLQCRDVIVVLLGLKRRRGDAMRDVDRWLVRELAFACWATRTDKKWQLGVKCYYTVGVQEQQNLTLDGCCSHSWGSARE